MRRFVKVVAALVVVLAAVFLIVRVPDTEPDAMWAKYGAAPSQKLELADLRTIHLRDEGPRDAPVILLLHGSNADLHTCRPAEGRLPRDPV